MKILWYSSVNELDYEMQAMFGRMAGYEFHLAIPEAQNAYFFEVDARPDFTSVVTVDDMQRVLSAVKPDILVHRYRRDHVPVIEAAERVGIPTLVWVTEQGPDRDIEWNRNIHFRNLAANTVFDQQYLQNRGIENVYYWPFGCLPWFHRPVPAEDRYRSDFVAYGNPIYTLYPSKRESIDTLVVPLVKAGYDVSLWGPKEWAGGWMTVPGVIEGRNYKGRFAYNDLPVVNSSAKIVLGITSNGRYGAFGSRFARALASRSFCIWHYSEGMEEMPEGFQTNVNCCWSRSPEETLELAKFYLSNEAARDKITEKGQQLVYEKLNYEKLVPPILHDVAKQKPARAYSMHYALRKDIMRRSEEGRQADAARLGYRLMAHDVTSVDQDICVRMAGNFLSLGKFRLAQRYLRRFQALTRAARARHARSAEAAPAKAELGTLYVNARQGMQELANLLRHASNRVSAFIENNNGALNGQVSARQSMHAAVGAGGSTATMVAPVSLDTVVPSRRVDASDADRLRDVSAWELFLATASRVPLDRRRILLAGDVLPGQADFLAYNCAPTTWLAPAADAADRTPALPAFDDPRRASHLTVVRDESGVGDFDTLVYFALEPSQQHDEVLKRLLGRMNGRGSVIVVWVPSLLDATSAFERVSARVLWERSYEGETQFDFDHGDALAGTIKMAGAWFGSALRDRLSEMVTALSRRLEPRTCHVTLDPIEILKSGHAWAEGYTAVLERCCQADGFECRPVTVESAKGLPRQREHCVLEVNLDGEWTTWDAMLGIGYPSTARQLIAQPDRGDDRIGNVDGPYAAKYQLDQMTGSAFWRGVMCVHPDLYSIQPNGTPTWPVDGKDEGQPGGDDWKWATVHQWSSTPCGSTTAGAAFGTRQYFDEVEMYRYQDYAPWMLEDLEFNKHCGKELLEVGVGMGTDHLNWARNGAICTGIDLTPRCIQITRHRFNIYGMKSRLMQMDAESLQFKDESFDVVYSFGVLHHTPNTQRAIDEVYRVLRPGGRAIVMLYHRDSIEVFKKLLFGILHGRFDNGMSLHKLLGEGELTTDGVYPLTKTYTRGEAMFLFRRFRNVENKVRQLVRGEFVLPYPGGPTMGMPEYTALAPVVDLFNKFGLTLSQKDTVELGKVFGWNVIIYADK